MTNIFDLSCLSFYMSTCLHVRIYMRKYRHIQFPKNRQMEITIPVLPGVSRFGSTTFSDSSAGRWDIVLFSSPKFQTPHCQNWLNHKLSMDADDVDVFCVSLDNEWLLSYTQSFPPWSFADWDFMAGSGPTGKHGHFVRGPWKTQNLWLRVVQFGPLQNRRPSKSPEVSQIRVGTVQISSCALKAWHPLPRASETWFWDSWRQH